MPQALEYVQALALALDGGRDDLAGQPGGGHPMAGEALREVQVAVKPAPMRGAVAGDVHIAAPDLVQGHVGQLWEHLVHAPLHHPAQAGWGQRRVAGAPPEQQPMVMAEAEIVQCPGGVGHGHVVADQGAGALGPQRRAGADIGADRHDPPFQLGQQALQPGISGHHQMRGAYAALRGVQGGLRSALHAGYRRILVDHHAGRARRIGQTARIGQRVQVRPGDRLPCDGQIIAGRSSIDESPVNGESVPRERGEGEGVFAGTVNLDGVLEIEVTQSAENNTIARVIKLVEEAQAAKAPVARFIDRFAFYYMPAVVGVALLVAIVPPLVSPMLWSESIYRALALLLIACPCALVISTPAAIAAGLSVGARNGLLMKGGAVLEQLGKLKRVALDKTGTLTAGTPTVTDVERFDTDGRVDKNSHDEIVRLAAALEQGSSHPLAVAISDYFQQQGLPTPVVQGARALAGQGVAGQVEGRSLTLASPRAVQSLALLSDDIKARIAALEAQGKSVAVLIEAESENERPLGLLALRDEPREDARQGLQALERLGVQVVMLSGDNARTVAAIGEQLGIEAEGELMPEDKAQRVRDWQAQGFGPIGKVGDGINDAPALAAAEVGIAMGSGTDVALETADAALLKNRVTGIAEMIALSRATMRNVKTNVALALGFKALFLVSTALGITGMWVAVMADTGATVLVTLNALHLLRYRFNDV